MRFLHTADIHLDSPMAGLAQHEGAAGWGNPTRRAFVDLISLAIAADVAFVVIAGDLFDADWKDYGTGLFFIEQMKRLARPCVLVRGNHDAASVITSRLTLPSNVFEFSSSRAHSIPLTEFDVALHGRSFPNRAVPEDISASYPAPVQGMLNIGVLHTSAEDPGRHGTYAPCNVAALEAKGYGYWALGHIHDRRVLADAPCPIVFPGNTQGRHINETGEKGATLVEVQDRQVVAIEHCPTDVLRWAAPLVSLEGVDAEPDLADRLRAALAAEAAAAGKPVIARLHLSGATPLHTMLAGDPVRLEAECRAAAAGVGDVHIESVRLRTTAPGAAAEHAELQDAFRRALEEPAVAARLLADLRRLSDLVPAGLYAAEPLPRTEEELCALLPDAWEAVCHELATS